MVNLVKSTLLSKRLLINKYKIIIISQIPHQLFMKLMSHIYYLLILYHSIFWGIRKHPLCGVMGFGQCNPLFVFLYLIFMVQPAWFVFLVVNTLFKCLNWSITSSDIISSVRQSICPSVNFLFFSRNSGPISTKLGTMHPSLKGIQVFFQMKGPAFFQGKMITNYWKNIDKI